MGQPSDVDAGENISPPVTVEAVDASGSRVTTFTTRINVELIPDPGALGGKRQDDPDDGLATFNNLSVSAPGQGYRLRATATGVAPDTSDAFDVAGGEGAVRLEFVQHPTGTAAGAAFSPAITVRAVRGDGTTDSAFTTNITLSIASGPTNQIFGTTTRVAASGMAAFNDLSIRLVGAYTLQATASGLTPDTSSAFTITPGPASGATSQITASPTSIPANGSSTSTITVTLRDAFGNPLTSGGNAVALTTSRGSLGPVSDHGDGTYTATLTSSTTAGTATVTGTVGGAGIVDDATVEFTQVGTPTLVVDVQPVSTPIGQPITPAVVVRATDGFGNTLTGFSGSATASMASNPTGAALSGTLVRPVQNGLARFDDLRLDRSGSGYRLGFSSPGIQGTTSAAFAITAGAASPTHSTITADPVAIPAGGSSTSTITVRLIDAGGAPLTSGGDRVTLSANQGTLGPVTDRGDGTYAASLRSSSTPGTATISGTVNGLAITDTATVTFASGSADLEVEVSVSDASPTAGDEVAYVVTVRNHGPDIATGVQLAQEIPARLGFASATTSKGDYDPVTALWTVGSLAPGERATLTLVLTVGDEGSE
ncbi:MAG: invasin domain 3-containing protein [Gemmatimonadota bacterium]